MNIHGRPMNENLFHEYFFRVIVNGEGNVNARQDSSKREREGKNKNKKEKNIFFKVEESKKSCVQT